MARLHSSCLGCLALATALGVWQAGIAHAGEPEAASATILGGGNSLLAEGSLALQEGRIAQGIQLTQEGLKNATDPREAAAGHSNLCGGYALLHDWAQALQQCNAAIELDHADWQAFNNRAAVYAGLGQYDLALADVHSGLELDPHSSILQKSLAVVEHNQKVIKKRDPSVLRS
jgi:tetratricopeptide (TPR) repeat protein